MEASGLFNGISFADYDLNLDKALDYGELFELASMTTFAEIEKVFRGYSEKYSSAEGARVSQATAKVGFACEKQGRPSEMLALDLQDIKKDSNTFLKRLADNEEV